MPLDQIRLDFEPGALALINWMLALIVFGVALELRPADFGRVLRRPRAALIGLSCQFRWMPAVATGLLWLLAPPPSVALGILLVAACPGGNVSNFLSSYARGDAALSVSMSAVSTLAAIVMTPFNFGFWAGVLPATRELLTQIALAPQDMVLSVLTILVLPTFAGMALARLQPTLAARLRRPMQALSLLVLFAFIAAAAGRNVEHLPAFLRQAFGIVLLVNACALLLGYSLARATGLGVAQARAVSFETGIQNSGFGLVLVFNFFAGLGGMAIVVAWWGVWHLVSGLLLARYWRGRSPQPLPDSRYS